MHHDDIGVRLVEHSRRMKDLTEDVAAGDPAALHRWRVAVRRARTLLRAAHDPALDALSQELRRVAHLSSPVRDLDVTARRLHGWTTEAGPDRAGAEALTERLERTRGAAHRLLAKDLHQPRYATLLSDLEGAAALVGSPSKKQRRTRADRALRRAQHAYDALPEEPDAHALHHLRIRVKRARYSAEGIRPRRLVRALKEVQDLLGDHQDAVVGEQLLRDAAAAPRLPRAGALSAGRTIERLRGQRSGAVEGLPAAWKRVRKAADRARARG